MGRILGIDFGTRRIGVALSDPDRRIASPIENYERRGDQPDARFFRDLIAEYGVDRIVVGLPVRSRGEEGRSARLAREWGTRLEERTGVRVTYVDERYSSVEADELLRAGGLKASRRRGRRDMIAAQILLQGFLDAGCPEHATPAGPLDDDPPIDAEEEP